MRHEPRPGQCLTFTITGALGGIAGALIGSAVGMLSPLLIAPLTVKGLIVTVIGGLGSIPGAIIAGLVVGAAENVFQFARGVTERDIYVMLLLFVFLVFRPGGIWAPIRRVAEGGPARDGFLPRPHADHRRPHACSGCRLTSSC